MAGLMEIFISVEDGNNKVLQTTMQDVFTWNTCTFRSRGGMIPVNAALQAYQNETQNQAHKEEQTKMTEQTNMHKFPHEFGMCGGWAELTGVAWPFVVLRGSARREGREGGGGGGENGYLPRCVLLA
jgi:hypothetical protein